MIKKIQLKAPKRLLLPCLVALLALCVVPLASAGNGHGNANGSGGQADAHQTQGTAGTAGDPQRPQPQSTADQNSGGANGQCPGGPYCSTRDGSPSQNGNGDGQANGKPCAGCVGKADNKNPQGQMPNGSDGNKGYECDGNNGIGKTNPAHTGCQQSPPPVCDHDCTPPPCQSNCTPPPACQHDCGQTPPPGCQANCGQTPPSCTSSCGQTPPPGCQSNCTPPPPVKKCGEAGAPKCPTPPVKHRRHPKPKHHGPVRCPKGMRHGSHGCRNGGIQVPRHCACHSVLRIVVRAKAGTVVRVKGAGVALLRRVGKTGRLVLKAHPTRKGILVVTAGGMVKRVGVTCAPEGSQLTG